MVMLRGLADGLADIIFPRVCLSCKNKLKSSSINNLICGHCWSKIKRNIPPFCRCCGRHLDKNNPAKSICPNCLKVKLCFDRAFSPCVYKGVIKELIHMFKYGGKDYLGPLLSSLMTDFIEEFDVPVAFLDLIIPVPLHKARLREREFNQSGLLAQHIGRQFHKDVREDVLIRCGNTKTQTDLDLHKRFANVKGAFCVSAKTCLRGKNILLVDDVLTSGATCSEAASALKEAGAGIVFALTLAN